MVRNEVFALVIKGKEIFYTDKNIKIPKKFIPETDEEKKEYEKAKDENELANICIKDCKLKDIKLIKKEII